MQNYKTDKTAIIHVGWGKNYLHQIVKSITDSIPLDFPHILLTETNPDMEPEWRALFETIIEVDFEGGDINRKSEMLRHLPEAYDTWLFLDADTRVLKPLSLGFEKARLHGLAIPMEVQYSLEAYTTFGNVMDRVGTPRRGQFHYNTGVMFFHLNDQIRELFQLWDKLCHENVDLNNNDQPYLTLAMEQMGFLPYTLSPSYSYRGFGELISGDVYIWHSYSAIPDKLNGYQSTWPLRRVYNGKIEQLVYRKTHLTALKEKIGFYQRQLETRGPKGFLQAAARNLFKF